MKVKLDKTAFESGMADKGYTIYSLADEMSVSPSTIYRILNGKREIGNDLLVKLLLAFDLNESDFDKLFIFK